MSILQQFKLDDRVALVTGSARGLGQAMAIGLAEAGADLCLVDVIETKNTRERITNTTRRAIELKQDLATINADRAGKLVDDCVAKLGGLDILVNNAGIIRRSAVETFSEKDWRDVLKINLDAVFYLSQAAGRYWLNLGKPGKIINTASMQSFQGGLTITSYAAAKSGVAGLTRAMANEWAVKGINVNAIAPGYLKTDVTAGIYNDPVRNKSIMDRIPIGRWGVPSDLKGVVVFLASDASDYMHGCIVPIDGGWLGR